MSIIWIKLYQPENGRERSLALDKKTEDCTLAGLFYELEGTLAVPDEYIILVRQTNQEATRKQGDYTFRHNDELYIFRKERACHILENHSFPPQVMAAFCS